MKVINKNQEEENNSIDTLSKNGEIFKNLIEDYEFDSNDLSSSNHDKIQDNIDNKKLGKMKDNNKVIEEEDNIIETQKKYLELTNNED